MSVFTKLIEDRIRIRVKPNSNAEDGIQNVRDGKTLLDKLADTLESGSTINLSELDGFRRLSNERDIQYRVYDEMREDSIISAALEMYADDATQYNRDGSIIWVDSDESEIAAFGNRLIDNLNLNRDAWQHIYTLCLYGDLYLETFRDDPKEDTDERITKMGSNNLYINPKGYILEEYVEAYDNPCELYDILEKGKTAGYIRVPMDKYNDNEIGTMIYKDLELETKQTVYKPDKFIHVSLFDGINRYPEKITIQTDNQSSYTYKVKRGKSILHDIYKIYQELKLMEDSLLLNRVTRSSIIRILQVEVGDSTKSQISNILKRLKQMMEQRNMLDKDKGTFKSQASPGPIDNIIYVPTRNGKGAVSASNIGGDVDVRSIVDLDYFKNKLYGGLKIPKQFLGDDMEGSGLSAGTSLTKLDARYARTIKRIQNAYIQGITTLINIFALDRNLDEYINNFTVKMVSPSTMEDQERDEQMGSRMDLIGTFIDLLGERYTDETIKEVFEYFVDYYLSDNELSEILKKDPGIIEDEIQDEDMEDNSSDFDGGFEGTEDFGSGFEDDLSDDEFDIDEESGEDIGFEDEESSEENSEEFGDFESDF